VVKAAEGFQARPEAPSWKEIIPGPMLFMGAPGSGKGTQAKAIMAAWGIPQISTGDLLRDHRARGTSLGAQATQLMDSGKLVPDDLVNPTPPEATFWTGIRGLWPRRNGWIAGWQQPPHPGSR
jgi:hypothetical protein